jgi:hypothetical protein
MSAYAAFRFVLKTWLEPFLAGSGLKRKAVLSNRSIEYKIRIFAFDHRAKYKPSRLMAQPPCATKRDKGLEVVRDSFAPTDGPSLPPAHRKRPWNHHFSDMAASILWAGLVLAS